MDEHRETSGRLRIQSNGSTTGDTCMPKKATATTKEERPLTEEERLKLIASVCLRLRKRADFFLNTEPENLTVVDFDLIADELERLARDVDNLLDLPCE